MSQLAGSIFLQRVRYGAGQRTGTYEFEFDTAGKIGAVTVALDVGGTESMDAYLLNVPLNTDELTSIDLRVTARYVPADGAAAGEAVSGVVKLDVPPDEGVHTFSGDIGQQVRFDFDFKVVVWPTDIVITPCTAFATVVTVTQTFTAEEWDGHMEYGPAVEAVRLNAGFAPVRRALVKDLGLQEGELDPPAGGEFRSDILGNMKAVSLAYAAYGRLRENTRTDVNAYLGAMRAQVRNVEIMYPGFIGPIEEDDCIRCRDWMGALNCLCEICNNRSKLSDQARDILNEILGIVDGLFDFTSANAEPLGLSPFFVWIADDPCGKLRTLAGMFSTICADCRNILPGFMSEVQFMFGELLQQLDDLKRLLRSNGIYLCGATQPYEPPPVSIPACRRPIDSATAYTLFAGGAHDPQFEGYEPVMAMHDRINDFEGTRDDIINVLGLDGPLKEPLGDGFLNRLHGTLEVLLYADLGRDQLEAGTLEMIDTFTADLRTNAMDAVGMWIKDPGQGEVVACDTCADWMHVLACLCRLCAKGGNTLGCGGVFDPVIANLMTPEIDELYERVVPMVHAYFPSMPVTELGQCRKLQAIYAEMARRCLQCTRENTTFLSEINHLLVRLREKLASIRSNPAYTYCSVCDDFCAGWVRMLNCLQDLCHARAELPHAVYDLVVNLFAAKVDVLYAMLYPGAAPSPGDPMERMCSRVAFILEDMDNTLCRTTYTLNAYTRVQLEILLLDFQERQEILQDGLDGEGVTLCSETEMCECRSTQSAYIYLQAAGSDGSDGSSPGVHLRWGFLRKLGEDHLAKGDFAGPDGEYPTTIGFNKPDDFVTIRRAEYKTRYKATVSIAQAPTTLVETGSKRQWIYKSRPVDTGITTDVVLTFADLAQYDSLRAVYNPAVTPVDFFKNYTEVVEIEAAGKPAFAFRLGIVRSSGGIMSLRAEALSEIPNQSALIVSTRSLFETTNPGLNSDTYNLISESIVRLRTQGSSCYISTIEVETYEDFYQATKRRNLWIQVGRFALTTDDGEAGNRLENAPVYDVDGRWPKFNDGVTVLISNYVDRWSSDEGLAQAVMEYLERSRTDIKATAVLSADANIGALPDTSSVQISYLDALKFVASDYHVARMLGLGHIDTMPNEEPDTQYIYLAEYTTLVAIDDAVTGRMTHLFLSLPTSTKDQRLPVTPELDPITFGLRVPDGTDAGALITDANGYAPLDDVRFINLNRAPLAFDQPAGEFFSDPTTYSRNDNTMPIAYGIEYRDEDTDPDWVMPELSHDDEYEDGGGVAETVMIPDRENPIFVHLERDPGMHRYAIYGINWFSRPSPLGAGERTVTTAFNRCALPPPSNVTVQYIQQEDPRIFTTAAEQAGRIGDTRVTFYWTHQQNMVYRRPSRAADVVEFYFRTAEPLVVRGEIDQVVPQPDGTVRIATRAIAQPSLGQNVSVRPEVASGAVSKFVGSVLATPNAQFIVTSVIASTPTVGAVFYVKPAKRGELVDTNGGNAYISTEEAITPQVNDRFLVVENLSNPSLGWSVLAKKVTLVNFAPLHTETVTNDDSSTTVRNIGGIYAPATITGQGEGVYEIAFNSYVLALHPAGDNDVDWYKGVVRVAAVAGGEKKVMEVWRVETNGTSPLKIYVHDPEYLTNPMTTGANINVNFHPGYRVYLHYDNGAGFTQNAIMPGAGQTTRYTTMALAAYDNDTGCRSQVGTPVMLMARAAETPVRPDPPIGPVYATRPDFYGKATYTFDTVVNPGGQLPYALVFQRANDRALLDAIYTPATVEQIITALAALAEGAFDAGWRDLVAGVYDTGTNLFKTYAGYRLPNPDRVRGTYDPPTYPSFTGAAPGTITTGSRRVIDDVLDAIGYAFAPLTKSPVLYQFIRSGTQTSNTAPVTHDANGDPIPPFDARYHPSPMASLLSAGNVRFTDYTLDGASRNLYFYCVTGMSSKLEMSLRSAVMGPVHLVNTFPPEAPAITSVTPVAANRVLDVNTGVHIEVTPYLAGDGVTKLRLYRALNAPDAAALRTMTLVDTFNTGDVLIDEFDDLSLPPFGQPLFYRVVALREIRNELNVAEYVPSVASKAVLTNVIDVENPPAPTITHTVGTTQPTRLLNVTLTWPATAYNGTYYLYRMTSAGAWRKFHTVQPGPAATTMSYPPGGDFTTYPETAELVKDDAGTPLYHRFKVVAENASGLLSHEENVLVI